MWEPESGAWPSRCASSSPLRVVGLDPFDTPLALARRNVAEAGLADRIELRPQRVQDLAEENRYDLAWVPVKFLPADVAARGLHRVHAALRPGGEWPVFADADLRGIR
jgi:predicted O-methyltransferase YrrM